MIIDYVLLIEVMIIKGLVLGKPPKALKYISFPVKLSALTLPKRPFELSFAFKIYNHVIDKIICYLPLN